MRPLLSLAIQTISLDCLSGRVSTTLGVVSVGEAQRGCRITALFSRGRAALSATEARRAIVGVDRGYRRSAPPCAAAAAVLWAERASRTTHGLWFEVWQIGGGVSTRARLARALTKQGVPKPRQGRFSTHTGVARLVARVAVSALGDQIVATDARNAHAFYFIRSTA